MASIFILQKSRIARSSWFDNLCCLATHPEQHRRQQTSSPPPRGGAETRGCLDKRRGGGVLPANALNARPRAPHITESEIPHSEEPFVQKLTETTPPRNADTRDCLPIGHKRVATLRHRTGKHTLIGCCLLGQRGGKKKGLRSMVPLTSCEHEMEGLLVWQLSACARTV